MKQKYLGSATDHSISVVSKFINMLPEEKACFHEQHYGENLNTFNCGDLRLLTLELAHIYKVAVLKKGECLA